MSSTPPTCTPGGPSGSSPFAPAAAWPTGRPAARPVAPAGSTVCSPPWPAPRCYADIEFMISTQEIIVRLLVALVLSGAIGLQRAFTGKAAGMRTHILVGVGS